MKIDILRRGARDIMNLYKILIAIICLILIVLIVLFVKLYHIYKNYENETQLYAELIKTIKYKE